MKNSGLLIVLSAIIILGFNQRLSAECQDKKTEGNTMISSEKTKVAIGKDLLAVEERDSSSDMRIGKRKLDILESLEGGASSLSSSFQPVFL